MMRAFAPTRWDSFKCRGILEIVWVPGSLCRWTLPKEVRGNSFDLRRARAALDDTATVVGWEGVSPAMW